MDTDGHSSRPGPSPDAERGREMSSYRAGSEDVSAGGGIRQQSQKWLQWLGGSGHTVPIGAPGGSVGLWMFIAS